MRVLLLDLGTDFGSGQAQTLLLARSLAERGFTPLTACPRQSPLTQHLAAEKLPFFPLPGHSLLNPAFIWSLERALRKRHIRVLHTQGRRAGRVGNFLKRLHGDKLLLVHSRLGSPKVGIRPSFYSKAQAVTCPTNEMLEQLTAAGVPPPRMQLLPFGVATDRFVPRRPRGDGRFVFLALAPLKQESGLSVLIEAMSLIREMEDLPPWEVRIAGSGPLFRELLDQAVRLKTEAYLALLGEQDPAVLLPDSDVLISPSLESEAENLDIKQGWTCAVPVIGSATTAHIELMQDKQDGLVTPLGNPVALAAAMVRCILEPALRERLTTNGSLRATAYSSAALADIALALYRRLDAHWPDPSGPAVCPCARDEEPLSEVRKTS